MNSSSSTGLGLWTCPHKLLLLTHQHHLPTILGKTTNHGHGQQDQNQHSHHSFIHQQLPKAWLTHILWKYEDEDPNTENGAQQEKKDACHAAGTCPKAEAKHRVRTTTKITSSSERALGTAQWGLERRWE